MTATPAIAPTVNTYTAGAPYLTVNEWLNAPTSVDIDELLPGGDEAAQQQALADCILRASSWIDDTVQQACLAATVNTQSDRYRVRADRTAQVPLKYKPVLDVSAVSVGRTVGQLAALTDLSCIEFLDGGVIAIPIAGYMVGERPLVQVTYVNGFPNTLTTSEAVAGDVVLHVADATGIYPGTVLTVSDGEVTEHVAVAGSYTLGATLLPLAAPLANAHSVGAAVTNLPPRVKQAAILLTSALVQTRGNDAIVLAAMQNPDKVSGSDSAAASNAALAGRMIASLRRTW